MNEVVDKRIGSRRPAWLNRNVAAMGATSLLSDAGHEAATAVLPAFLAALGLPPVALGVIEGASDALASLAKDYVGSAALDAQLGAHAVRS